MNKLIAIAASLTALSSLVGCGSGDDTTTPPGPPEAGLGDAGSGSAQANPDAECPVVVSEANCDKTQRPIVFVHGTYASGDNIMSVALLFGSNGYCSDRFVSMDYDSLVAISTAGGPLSGTVNNATPAIDAAIDAVLSANPGFSQVDLIGHSQGAAQAYAYLQDPAHAAKVAHFVQLAGGPQSAPPGPPDASGVPTLSISSYGDVVAGPQGVTGAEKTVVFETQDHQAVCASVDTFVAIWQYLHQGADGGPDGQYPKYTSVQCSDPMVTLSGIAETLGDNSIPSGGKLEVYEVGSDPRDAGAPVQTFGAGDGGAVTWQAKRLQQYEFRGIDSKGNVVGHIYFSPFRRDNRWLRFLQPSQNVLAQIATSPVTSLNDNAATSFLFRTSKGAFRSDLGDSLIVNGYDVLNAQDAVRQTVTVGLFAYDANKDGKTQGGVQASILPYFMRGTDLFVASSPPALVDIRYAGLSLTVPNWPSVAQGITEVMFVP
jgi:hypothetical protein